MTWEEQMLALLGAPFTQENTDFLDAWAAREGSGMSASQGWNPFNVRNQPNGGFWGWTSQTQGVTGTADFILNNGYSQILNGLRSGQPFNANMASDLSTWSGGGYSAIQKPGTTQTAGFSAPSNLLSRLFGSGYSMGTVSDNRSAVQKALDNLNPAKRVEGMFTTSLVFLGATAAFAVGALWIIFGNQNTRDTVISTAKTAAKAAEVAA